MKISLQRLREIITEEVIKEELAPEIAAPAIAAMLQGTDSVDTSEIFGAVFDEMYGEGALEDEAERMASAEEEPEVRQPIGFGRQPEEVSMSEPGQVGFRENISEIIQQELALVLVEGLEEALLNEAEWSFKDPGPHVKVHPDSHWGQQRRAILDKKEKDRAWAAGAEERGKERERKEKHKVDTELQNKLHSYIAMLKDFIEKARTFESSYGREGDKNVMDDIVNLLYGKLPYMRAADISSIDRELIQELGSLIRALAKPYNAADQAMQHRDRETHPESYDQELRRKTDLWLASHGIMQENIDIEIIDD
jgi:hypothetical protein